LHALVGAHLLGGVKGNHLAIHHDGDLVSQAKHHAHVVLHGQQCAAFGHLLDEVDEARGLAAAHAGSGFVEQDDPGATGDGDTDLQRALLGVGEVDRQRVALFLQLDHLHELLGTLVGVIQPREEAQKGVLVAHAPEHAAAQVLEHAEVGEDVGDLEAAREAHAVDLEGASCRQYAGRPATPRRWWARKRPADEVEQRGLARTVGGR
jgi:hypothetical protein